MLRANKHPAVEGFLQNLVVLWLRLALLRAKGFYSIETPFPSWFTLRDEIWKLRSIAPFIEVRFDPCTHGLQSARPYYRTTRPGSLSRIAPAGGTPNGG